MRLYCFLLSGVQERDHTLRKVLLFIPMYNCEKQIYRVLEQLNEEVLKYVSEVIIINNRSTDNGENVVIDYCMRHPGHPIKLMRNRDNFGLGGSHKVAFQYAVKYKYDYVIVLHGDDQGSIKDLIPFIKTGVAFKYDSFLGSRFMKGSKLVNYSAFRIIGNHIFNVFMSICLKRKITDLGSGLNMYKVDYLKTGFYYSFINNLTFNVYMLIYGVHSKSKFTFFPLTWREDDQISNAKFFKQAKEIVIITLKYILGKEKFSLEENIYSKMSYTSDVIYDYSEANVN